MSSVIVDGEEVKFEGDVPIDPSQIYNLLMEALSEQARVVVSFAVDGKDSLKDDQFPSRYDAKAIFDPSGDQEGPLSVPELLVRRVWFEPSAAIT